MCCPTGLRNADRWPSTGHRTRHSASDPPDRPATLRALLERYGLRARKELGQHFLCDPNILERIVRAAELTPDDTVLEIGPGPGMLTHQLARAAGRVVAVELDEGMVNLLRTEMADLPNVEIVHGDILKLGSTLLLQPSPGRFEGCGADSLQPWSPTCLTTSPRPPSATCLEAVPPPERLVLTLQQEVAQRIVALPGDMSLLAVSVQFYGQPRIVARIPAGAFVPAPQVDSASTSDRHLPEHRRSTCRRGRISSAS